MLCSIRTLPASALVRPIHCLLAVLCLMQLSAAPRAGATDQLAGHDLSQPGGLAVLVGRDADTHALELAAAGRWLVRIIAADDTQLASFRERTEKLHPLISVAAHDTVLPFADQTVNLVVLGADSRISRDEANRVLAPGCVLLTADASGKLTRTVKPADPRYAPWSHWAADAHASGVSADEAVAPSNALRWWSQRVVGSQIRSANGIVAVFEEETGSDRRGIPAGVQGIDAWSGVPLWYRPSAISDSMSRFRTAAASHPLGFLHIQAGEMNPVVLTDLHTGDIKVTYDQGLSMPVKWGDPENLLGGSDEKGNGHPILLVWDNTLYQAYGFQVAALDIPTGKLHWKVKLENPVTKAILSRDGKTIYLQETSQPKRSFGRWGSFATVAVTALNATDGKQRWRNDDWQEMETLRFGKRVKGTPWLSELIEVDGVLFAWDHASNIGADHHGDLFRIDAATGKILWHFEDANGKDPNDREYNKHGPMTNNLVAWNGRLFSKHAEYSTDKPTMDRDAPFFLGGNQRCVRLSGAANFLVYGFTSFLGKDGTTYQTGLIRGNCAMPNYATFGSVISVTDETCSCYNGLRGQTALIPEQTLTPIPDDQRLTRPAAMPVTHIDHALPDTALTQEWVPWPSMRFFPDHQRTEPVTVNGLTLHSHTQKHLVIARRGDKDDAPIAWSYRADGRIFAAPTVVGNAVYVATAAGTVTKLDAATGKPAWQFMAAPMQSQIVMNGQLESRWPVWNTVAKDGTLYIAAGRHAELDSGIWCWALDADTGAIRHRVRIFQPMTVAAAGSKPGSRDPLRFRGQREVASTSILLGGITLDKDGKPALVSRQWNKSGSRPSAMGYWKDYNAPNDRKTYGKQSFDAPNQKLWPLDFAAWDGKLMDPIGAWEVHTKFKWGYESPFSNAE